MSDEVLLYEVWEGNVVTYTVMDTCEVAVKDGLGMGKCGRPATHRYTREPDTWTVCADHGAMLLQNLNRHDVGSLVPLEER